jgi:hypothetical protein
MDKFDKNISFYQNKSQIFPGYKKFIMPRGYQSILKMDFVSDLKN